MSRKRARKPDRNEQRFEEKSYGKKKPSQPPIRRGFLQPIIPKTKGQEEFIDAIHSHELTICDGPAGTGKTMLAFGSALHYRESDHRIKRIIIVRPVIPAGDDDLLGALPGTLEEKMGPYLAPFYKDIAPQLISADASLNAAEYQEFLANYILSMNIEVVPLAYMRGRTFSNAFVILDEAQNCTKTDLKLFLTRIGEHSKVVIEGDSTQTDRDDSGFEWVQDKLSTLDEVKIVQLQSSDIIRNPLIAKILRKLD